VPRRYIAPLVAAGVAGAAAILAYPPLGTRMFGTMDGQWLAFVRDASAFNFPGSWTVGDWVNVSMSIALPVCVGINMAGDSPRRARFLFISAALSAVGMLTMLIAGWVPYRILLQGQPYRALWILQVLEIPLAFWLAARSWQMGSAGQVASVLLIGFFGLANPAGPELVLSGLAIGLFLLVAPGQTSRTDPRDSVVPNLVGGVVTGLLVSGLIRAGLIVARRAEILVVLDSRTYAGLLANSMGPLVAFAVVLWCVAVVVQRRVRGRTIAACALVLAVATHSVAFAMPRLRVSRESHIGRGRDVQFVRDYFERRHATTVHPLRVYEGIWEDVDLVWFELQAENYFNLVQLSGALFSRETAVEAQRRASIVRPFELERYDAVGKFLSFTDRLMITSVFKPTQEVVSASEADLFRLCSPDEQIDVVILKHDFGGLAAASNGLVHIYECAQVRAARHDE
jgi:hypothetical protein